MKRLTVLMMFGGESSEHEVSVKSAKNVYTAIDKDKYEVVLGYIDKRGKWWLLDDWSEMPDEASSTQLVIAPGTKSVLTVPGSSVINVDVLFPVLHGKFGEDGTIQGLAAMSHIPIVGPGVESSAVCMDKHVTKLLLEGAGIPVVPWVIVRPDYDIADVTKQVESQNPTGPWFVKPSRAGSSVGVSRVTDIDSLAGAIDTALKHDDLVLVEPAVIGRELEVAVLGNVPDHKASGVGEIVAGGDFYDYDEKYSSSSSSKVVLHAELPGAVSGAIRKYALDAYSVLGCSGLSRIDFLLNDGLEPFVMEVNTLPGFTDISMYPKLWNEEGVSYEALIDRLIQLSLE